MRVFWGEYISANILFLFLKPSQDLSFVKHVRKITLDIFNHDQVNKVASLSGLGENNQRHTKTVKARGEKHSSHKILLLTNM